MRLIDADELLKNWGQTFFAMGGDRLGANGEEIMFYLNGLIREIKNAPTVNKCDNCDLMLLEKTRGKEE